MENQILSLLPAGYEYKVLETGQVTEQDFSATFLCNLHTESDALVWMMKLKEVADVGWRVWRTFPNSGRYNVYKIVYRCEHNSYRKLKENGSRFKRWSKITGCVAELRLTIRRFVKKSKAQKPPSEEERRLPCRIVLNNTHNHPRRDRTPCTDDTGYSLDESSVLTEFSETLDHLKRLVSEEPSRSTVVAMNNFIVNFRKHTPTPDSVHSALALWGKYGVARGKRHSSTTLNLSRETLNISTGEEMSLPREIVLNYPDDPPTDGTEAFYTDDIDTYSPEQVLYLDSNEEDQFDSTFLNFCETLDQLKRLVWREHPSQVTLQVVKNFVSDFQERTPNLDSLRSALGMWGKREPPPRRSAKKKCVSVEPVMLCEIQCANDHDYTVLIRNEYELEEV